MTSSSPDWSGFETRAPSHQNAVDLLSGTWISKFPNNSGLVGGPARHFDDVRVDWAASILGGLHSRSILELGPFEAYNTYQFHMAGASRVTSIESSRVNFLKCLIIKNIFDLNATILHGDFQKFLASAQNRFDICWASGVLYHMVDPVRLLVGIRRAADAAFIWTHYFDEECLTQTGDIHFFEPAQNKTVQLGNMIIELHCRNYKQAAGLQFSGGEESFSYWMTKTDIMGVLTYLGYNEIVMGVDNPDHPSGPAMFLIARVNTDPAI